MTDNTSIAAKLPTGRPPGSHSVRVLAARLAAGSIAVLDAIAKDKESPAADRVRAAEVILRLATHKSAAGTEP